MARHASSQAVAALQLRLAAAAQRAAANPERQVGSVTRAAMAVIVHHADLPRGAASASQVLLRPKFANTMSPSMSSNRHHLCLLCAWMFRDCHSITTRGPGCLTAMQWVSLVQMEWSHVCSTNFLQGSHAFGLRCIKSA